MLTRWLAFARGLFDGERSHARWTKHEIRLGVRTLAGVPSFTVPALVVLALGIASTTTIVSVLAAGVWPPLDTNVDASARCLVRTIAAELHPLH